MDPSSSNGFQRVAVLNEAAKELVSQSFKINLLALAAMVQAKRGGSGLRGFDEVSAQMRNWSAELHAELAKLRELSRQVVSEVSADSKQARLLGLLERGVGEQARPQVTALLRTRRGEHEERGHRLTRLWRRVDAAVSDLDQLGMMASVLSRSAMIEATSGNAEQRAQLAQVSQEFYDNAQRVTGVLSGLLKHLRQ